MRPARPVEGLLVPPELLTWLRVLMADGVARSRREGWVIPPEVVELVDVIARGARAVSAGGNSAEAHDLDRFRSDEGAGVPPARLVDVKTAATVIGVSERRVRQLLGGRELAGTRRPGGWLLDADAVARFSQARMAKEGIAR